jgi:hypothetical protein
LGNGIVEIFVGRRWRVDVDCHCSTHRTLVAEAQLMSSSLKRISSKETSIVGLERVIEKGWEMERLRWRLRNRS